MAEKPSPSAPANPTKPWFTKNWKWAVPVGCLGMIVLLAMFVCTVFLIVETSFKKSDAYTQALARAAADPRVIEKMGQPLEAGWLTTGNISVSGPSGNASLSIPVSGPASKGTLYVVAKKSAGRWQFETLEVEVAGDPNRIDLLETELTEPAAPTEQ